MLDHNFLIQIDALYTEDIIKYLPKSRRLLCWLVLKKYFLLSCVDISTTSQLPSFQVQRSNHLHPDPPPHYFIPCKTSLPSADLFSLLIVGVQVYCSSQEQYSNLPFSEYVLWRYRQKTKWALHSWRVLPADCCLHFLQDELQIFFSGRIKHFGTT